MKANITGKTVVILFCINLFALLFFLRPPAERGIAHAFISLIFMGAVPILPRGLKQFARLRPDIYSLSAVSLLPSLLLGFYSLYENKDISWAFFLPVCFLLFSFALLLYLGIKDSSVFNRIAFALSAILPILSFISALFFLFNDFSLFFSATAFAFILIYGGILTNFIFCVLLALQLTKK